MHAEMEMTIVHSFLRQISAKDVEPSYEPSYRAEPMSYPPPPDTVARIGWLFG